MEKTLDIFLHDAFSFVNLRRTVPSMPFVPQKLGQMQLFAPKPLMGTDKVHIFTENGTLKFVPDSERGTPDSVVGRDTGDFYTFQCRRMAQTDTVRASELLGITDVTLPETIRLRNAMDLVVKRTEQLKTNQEATKEFHRLGALFGKLYDPTGRLLVDYFAKFGIAEPTLVDVDFAGWTEDNFMQQMQDNFYRPIMLALKDRALPNTQIGALCSDTFWSKLMTHPGFRKVYELLQQAQAMARAVNPFVQPNAWQEVDYAGIRWINYRGSTGGEIVVPAGEARFFPINARDVFDVYWAPGETLQQVALPGQPEYLMVQPDTRTAIADHINIYLRSYPLYACIFPPSLMRGRIKP